MFTASHKAISCSQRELDNLGHDITFTGRVYNISYNHFCVSDDAGRQEHSDDFQYLIEPFLIVRGSWMVEDPT